MNKNDEVICTVKGYVNNQSYVSTLLLINRNSNWLLINKQLDKKSTCCPVIISVLDSSFYHTFTANGEKVTKTPTGQTTWKVEWNGRDQIKNTFLTRSAVEARSLDRGFRIITTELHNSLQNNSLQSIPSSIGSSRYGNQYSVEPHLMSSSAPLSPHLHPPVLPSLKSKKEKRREHCHHCGRKYFSSRRSRCWASVSAYLCCTSDFDQV